MSLTHPLRPRIIDPNLLQVLVLNSIIFTQATMIPLSGHNNDKELLNIGRWNISNIWDNQKYVATMLL